MIDANTLSPTYFSRMDNTDDEHFYSFPRKVVHIDDHAIASVSYVLGELLSADGKFLDLMSSWRSHLPAELDSATVVGLGMNAEEMADNPQLDSHIVHNLNRTPQLPFNDAEFDGAFCTVSVQYLTQPISVFQEVARVLKPDTPFIVSFSNRCFPQKAVAVWQSCTEEQHVQLVGHYFTAAEGWQEPLTWSNRDPATLANDAATMPPRALGTDPLYVVWALKERP